MPGLAPSLEGERETLLAYLEQQRNALRVAAYGLTEEQIRDTPSASSLSVGGIIKHVSSVERWWQSIIIATPLETEGQDYLATFVPTEDETLAGLLETYAEVAADTVAMVEKIDEMGSTVPVPPGVPWFPDDVERWSIRWLLLHLIEETARHAGHADIVRETVDGATGFALLAGYEDWPETPWLKPWKPA